MAGAEGRPEVCVGAVAVADESILLIRRGQPPSQGSWSLPGGRVERGETLAEAVVREVAEETGLEAVCDDLVGWVERIGDGYHYVIFDFRVTVLDVRTPRAGDDADRAQWIPLSGLGRVRLTEGLDEFLTQHGILPAVY